jgi:hypothetical protein
MSPGSSDDGRQDPFRSLAGEPVEDMMTGIVPSVLQQRPRGQGGGNGEGGGSRRITPIHPSEIRRRKRTVTVTFSNQSVPLRLRALAQQWGWVTGSQQPNVSKLIEYLLLPQLEAAERGEIDSSSVETATGEQWQ